MIGLLLAIVLQTDSPSSSPSVTPSPSPRPVPTAKPLPQPTPPYVIAPKGWGLIPYPPHRSASNFPRVAGWTRYTGRGEEDIIVTRVYSGGRTAQGIAQADAAFDRGGRYPILVANRAHPLCSGTVPGWEVVSKDYDGVGAHTTDMLYAADGVKGYELEYYHESAYPPDPQAVAALRSFCPTHAQIRTDSTIRGAIVPPGTWLAKDVSMTYHLSAGSATMYRPAVGDEFQMIMVYRESTPDGVSADVDADIAYGVDSLGKGPHKILSRRGVQLCNGDGWIVDVRWYLPHRDLVDMMVFEFGAPHSYLAIYRRFASAPTLPEAIKAISTLCPPK